MKIKDIRAREVLDSRGNPTVAAEVTLENGGEVTLPEGGIVNPEDGIVELPNGGSGELPNGETISYSYNDIGQVVSKTFGTGNNPPNITYTYDNFGRLIKEVYEDGKVHEYVYDRTGNITYDRTYVNNDKTEVANVAGGKLVGWVEITDAVDLADYALTTDANGKISIDGLDSDTYYLREIEAPAGYNKLAEDMEVVITSEYDQKDRTAEYFFEKTNENDGKEIV